MYIGTVESITADDVRVTIPEILGDSEVRVLGVGRHQVAGLTTSTVSGHAHDIAAHVAGHYEVGDRVLVAEVEDGEFYIVCALTILGGAS